MRALSETEMGIVSGGTVNPSPYDNPYATHLDKRHDNNGQPEDQCNSIGSQASKDACKVAIIVCGEDNVDRVSVSTNSGGGGGANVSLGQRAGGVDVDLTTKMDIEVACNSNSDPDPNGS